jgi:hypothetical protein
MDKYAEYCSVLGLDTVGSITELKSVYRNAVKRWHPDRYMFDRGMQQAAAEKLKRINTAYEYVSELLGSCPRKPQNPGFPKESLLEIFLRSSQIISTAYDYSDYSLYIKFKSSNIYRFCDVPPRIYDELISAESPAVYARKHVYSNYKYVRCLS